jgi:thiol:disulfide interchange protein DsbD
MNPFQGSFDDHRREAQRRAWLVATMLAALLLAILPDPTEPGRAASPGARATTAHSSIELLADRGSVAPGETFLLAVRHRLAPGWHTYWVNPGDSGMAPEFRWSLPDGMSVGPALWPVPSRQPFGPLTNYGFGGEVFFLFEARAPGATMAALQISLEASWLACEKICVPEEASLAIRLATGASASSASAPAIAAARGALPRHFDGEARFQADGGTLRIALARDPQGPALRAPHFFPAQPGLVDHAAAQRVARLGDRTVIEVPLQRGAPAPLVPVAGVLVEEGGRAHAVAAVRGEVPRVPQGEPPPPIAQALLLALLGGIVLNLMPCVFPILSMKALALAALPAGDARGRRRDGVAYALGVMASFGAIAGAMLLLREAGAELGWGFQFQSPVFVAVVACVMLGVALNLSGAFEVRLSVAARAAPGAFLAGILAVVVATPCTAPFMAAALGAALAADRLPMVAIVMALGAGFALPFLAVALAPGIARILPRPGPWMSTFRQAMAFPMYATACWLLWVLARQAGPDGLALGLAALLLTGLAAWLAGKERDGGGLSWSSALALAALAAAAVVASRIEPEAPRAAPSPADAASTTAAGEPFSHARLDALRAEGRPVLVNMTAAWCITCLFNERTALAAPAIAARFASGEVAYLKGDWTNRDPVVSDYLRGFGRAGVPLYVFYPRGGGAPEILPQVLSETILREAFAR